MNENADYPGRLDVAARFATDVRDYLVRYRCTFYSTKYEFQAIKSRRAKAYIDLRLGLESAFKAFIALRQPFSAGGKPLIKAVEKNGHHLRLSLAESCRLWRIATPPKLQSLVLDCDALPIGLRYTFDAWDFRDAQDELYYRTIGSDHWLYQLETAVASISEKLDGILTRRSRVISLGSISINSLMGGYSKYGKSTKGGED